MLSSFLSVSFVGSSHDSVTLSPGSIIVTHEINEDWDLTQAACISNICQNGDSRLFKNQKPHLSDTQLFMLSCLNDCCGYIRTTAQRNMLPKKQ